MSLLDIAMLTALLLVCGGAFLFGGKPERLVAAALLANFAVHNAAAVPALVSGEAGASFSAETSLVLDMVLLGVLVPVALAFRPLWTLFVAAFQLVALLTSVILITDDRVSVVAYVTAQNMLWWLCITALALGVWEAAASRTASRKSAPA